MEMTEAVMNPVQQRIFQYLLVRETTTVKEIRGALADIPSASLYRHMKILTENSILTVEGKNRIRGTVESIYRLNKDALELDDKDGAAILIKQEIKSRLTVAVKQKTEEERIRKWYIFIKNYMCRLWRILRLKTMAFKR